MKRFLRLFAAGVLAVAGTAAHAAGENETVLFAGKSLASWSATIGAFEAPPSGAVALGMGEVADKPGALTLQWQDAWFTALRFEGGAPLDLRPYAAGGTLEFDFNALDLAQGGIYFTMRCGPECYRKRPSRNNGKRLLADAAGDLALRTGTGCDRRQTGCAAADPGDRSAVRRRTLA